jgi:8-oxo-dGTP diphosphatase
MSYNYQYPRAMNTVDAVVFGKFGNRIKVLLIQRGNEPFKNKWAFPGGFVEMDEKLITSAIRELKEETGLENVALQQFRAYGNPGRDPRGRNISVIFFGFTDENNANINAADDAENANWFALDEIPPMAFDHNKILNDLIDHLTLLPKKI